MINLKGLLWKYVKSFLKFKKIILVVIDLIRHNLEVKEEEILVLTEMDKIKTDSVLIEIDKMD